VQLNFFLNESFQCAAEHFQSLGEVGRSQGGAACFRSFGVFVFGCWSGFFRYGGWCWGNKLAGINGLCGQALQLLNNQLRFASEVDNRSSQQQIVAFLEGGIGRFNVVKNASWNFSCFVHKGKSEEGFAAPGHMSGFSGYTKDSVDFLLETQVTHEDFSDTLDGLCCIFWGCFCFFRLTHIAPMPNGVCMRTTTFIFLCFIAGQALADEPRWEIATRTEGITVLARKAEGENIAEVKAIGLIQAPPEEVWKILMDFDNYTQTMPYTEVARRIAQESDGKTFYFYTVLNPPLVSRRDYVLKMRDVSAWENGKGFLKLSWAVAEDADQRVPPQPDKVRLKLSNGYWLLEPREGGKTTFATYYLLTDGGGTMPAWVMNKANKTAAPDVILAVRKAVKPPRK